MRVGFSIVLLLAGSAAIKRTINGLLWKGRDTLLRWCLWSLRSSCSLPTPNKPNPEKKTPPGNSSEARRRRETALCVGDSRAQRWQFHLISEGLSISEALRCGRCHLISTVRQIELSSFYQKKTQIWIDGKHTWPYLSFWSDDQAFCPCLRRPRQ